MEQPDLFAAPAIVHDVARVGPQGQPLPPINGATPAARHASYTGAVHATQARGEKVAALLQLLTNHGPLTLNECADRTGWPLSSICSLKSAIEDQLEPDGFDIQDWGEGRVTKRTRWRVRR